MSGKSAKRKRKEAEERSKKKSVDVKTKVAACPYATSSPQVLQTIARANSHNYPNVYHWRMRLLSQQLLSILFWIYMLGWGIVFVYWEFPGLLEGDYDFTMRHYIVEGIVYVIEENWWAVGVTSLLCGWVLFLIAIRIAHMSLYQEHNDAENENYMEVCQELFPATYIKHKVVLAFPLCGSHNAKGGWSEWNLKVWYQDEKGKMKEAYSYLENREIYPQMSEGSRILICRVYGYLGTYRDIALIPYFCEN